MTACQFKEVYDHLGSMRDNKNRTKSQALAIYLFWLKTGVSQDQIVGFFDKKNLTQQQISAYLDQIRNELSKSFVSNNLGAKSLTRNALCSHNTPFVRVFCNDSDNKKAALLADGTYLKCEKSFNHEFQRLSYSLQKKYNLVKPFLICAPDEYIIDIYGPFPATWNDATILETIMNTDDDLKKLLLDGDYFILDRGFRDALKTLKEKYKLETMMPCFLSRDKKQFTTKEANDSRLCTKLRWVVEGMNGLIKARYRLFDHRIENTLLPHIMKDIRIAGALVNKFCKRLISDKENALEIARNMLINKNNENELMTLVLEKRLHRKDQFLAIKCNQSELSDFPRLSIECLQNEIMFGTYQLNQSLSYLASQFNKNDSFFIYKSNQKLLKNDLKIIKTNIPSRYMANKQYRVYIRYVKGNTACSIKDWYCECKNGTRTLGCCCHVSALLYYLAYARHVPSDILKQPAIRLNSVLINVDPKSHKGSKKAKDSNKLKNKKKQIDKLVESSSDFLDKSGDEDCRAENQKKSLKRKNNQKKVASLEPKIKINRPNRLRNNDKSLEQLLDLFVFHSPPWGGKIVVVEDYKRTIQYSGSNLVNTCSFDYFIFSLWLSTKLSENVRAFLADTSQVVYLDKSLINKVIENIDKNMWNEAKTLWILEIIQATPNLGTTFSTLNDSYNVFGRAITQHNNHLLLYVAHVRESNQENHKCFILRNTPTII